MSAFPQTKFDPSSMTLHSGAAHSNAARSRRYRNRRKRGGVVVQFEVVGTALDDLTALGWLAESQRGDKHAVTNALIRLAGAAMAEGIRRP